MEKIEVDLQQLEEVADRLEQKSLTAIPPMFELFTTFFSIAIGLMFFAYPEMLHAESSNPSHLFNRMLVIMPQTAWSFAFFGACMLKISGLLFNWKWMRVTGLTISALLYGTLAVCYAFNFPSISCLVFADMTLFCLISIPFVKHTSVRQRKVRSEQDE